MFVWEAAEIGVFFLCCQLLKDTIFGASKTIICPSYFVRALPVDSQGFYNLLNAIPTI